MERPKVLSSMESGGENFVQVITPTASVQSAHPTGMPPANEKGSVTLVGRPNWILYTSVLISLFQPLQYGWSTSQLNLTTFNEVDQCNARPVAEDTCLMFPGHSKLEWTFAVNAWIVGGMIGSLATGSISDAFGRRRTMLFNCGFIVAGAVIQMSASKIWVFVVGRVLSGIASGCATGVVSVFINEVAPPHLRNKLGVMFQISITIGIWLVGLTFFFANTSSGWRYIAGVPIVLAGLFVALAPFAMVESPAWLLMKGRREEAEQELTRLFGEENVPAALGWLESVDEEAGDVQISSMEACGQSDSNLKSLLVSPMLFRQLLVAATLACAQQLSGINAVFFYSSDMFSNAGISDDRIGTLIVNTVNVIPTTFAGLLTARYGNRSMLLNGIIGMFASAVGMTVSLIVGMEAMSIVFTATYVAAFEVSLGPLAWVIIADLFPDSIRATGSSICIACNWLSNLVVGVCYPYIADALDDYGFVPFIVILGLSYFFVLRTIPETAGKTNEEIQREFQAMHTRKEKSRI